MIMWRFKILIGCFLSNQFDELEHLSYFLNIWSNKNVWNIDLYINKFIWFNKFDEIRPCINGDLSIVDWLSCVTFFSLKKLKSDFVGCKIFCKNSLIFLPF